MKLYHFTSGNFLVKILAEGLRKGVVPWSMNKLGEVGLVRGHQWLTRNPAFGAEWARSTAGRPYRLDEFRLTVDVPLAAEVNLARWLAVRNSRNPPSAEFLDTFPDHPDWFLYHGAIPPNWIVGYEKNPVREALVIPEQN